jgi:predicted  nucleic acid-binding Zn-ribbon protein
MAKKMTLKSAAKSIGAALGSTETAARSAAEAAEKAARNAAEAAEDALNNARKGAAQLTKTVSSLEKDLKRLQRKIKKSFR